MLQGGERSRVSISLTEGLSDVRAANASLMRRKSPRGVPLCCDASAPQNNETKDRTEDGQDCNSSGDNSTNGATRQRPGRGTVAAVTGIVVVIGTTVVVRRPGSSRGISANARRQRVDSVHSLGLNLATADNDVAAVAGNTVYGHVDERGSGLEDVGVGWHLANVVHNRTVVVDGVGVVQLESTLTHAHGVSGPTWADDHDLG